MMVSFYIIIWLVVKESFVFLNNEYEKKVGVVFVVKIELVFFFGN